MFKNDVRVNSPLNKSPMSTKSFLAIVTACLDNSSSVRLSSHHASIRKNTACGSASRCNGSAMVSADPRFCHGSPNALC
jgi:hypothetical protein